MVSQFMSAFCLTHVLVFLLFKDSCTCSDGMLKHSNNFEHSRLSWLLQVSLDAIKSNLTKRKSSFRFIRNSAVLTGIMRMKNGALETTLKDAMNETEEIIYSVVGDLLERTGINAQEVNSLLFLSGLLLGLKNT